MSILNKIKITKLCSYYREKGLKENNYYMLANENIEHSLLDNSFDLELYKEWDDVGSIPLKLGTKLEKLLNNENYKLYIYRTAIFNEDNIYDNNVLDDILINGIVNNRHTLTNGTQKVKNPPVTDTSDFVESLVFMEILLKTHRRDSFGNNTTGTVLFILPKNYVDDEGEILVDPSLIYNYDENDIPHIKPEFIIGVTTLNDENYVGECKFYSKEEILNKQKRR